MRKSGDGNPAGVLRDSMRLAVGKIPPRILREVVFQLRGASRPELLVAPGIGEDTSVLDLSGELLVTSTDPITGARDKAGWLAVKVALNDLGAAGAEPVAILVTLLLPEGTTLGDLRRILADIDEACREEKVTVAGGHSEVTSGIEMPVVSITAFGKTEGRKVLTSGDAQPGDEILVTKWAGLEGTAILVRDFAESFEGVLTESEIAEAQSLFSLVSVTRDGLIAAKNGASACHDATEGGVLGAIYEMCQASGLGAEVNADLIPVLPVTGKVAGYVGIDPLKLVSSGCLVVTAPEGVRLAEVYKKSGISAQVVGRMTSGEEIILRRDGTCMRLDAPESDELWRARGFLVEARTGRDGSK